MIISGRPSISDYNRPAGKLLIILGCLPRIHLVITCLRAKGHPTEAPEPPKSIVEQWLEEWGDDESDEAYGMIGEWNYPTHDIRNRHIEVRKGEGGNRIIKSTSGCGWRS